MSPQAYAIYFSTHIPFTPYIQIPNKVIKQKSVIRLHNNIQTPMNEIDYQKIFQLQFHDINYIITIQANNQGLFLSLEDKFNGQSWENFYQPNYVQQITSKTGNLKRYNVFIKMLITALTGTSDSVHIDILTHHDLQIQALRKSGTSSKITDPKFINKRYLIMSYMAQFDKVHYPLPLQFISNPNPQKLKLTIRRLSQQLQCLQINPKTDALIKQLSLIKHENQLLKSKIKTLIKNENKDSNNINNTIINKQIQQENKNIKQQLSKIKQLKDDELNNKNKIIQQHQLKIQQLQSQIIKYQQNYQQYQLYQSKFNRFQNQAKQIVSALQHSRQNQKKSKLKITNLQKQLQKIMKQLKKNQNSHLSKNNNHNSPRKSDAGSIKSKSKSKLNINTQKNLSVYDSDTQSSRLRRNGRASPYRQNTRPIQSSKSAKKKKQQYERANAISKYSNISNLYNKDQPNRNRSRSKSRSVNREQTPPSDNFESPANLTQSLDYNSDNDQDNKISSTMTRLRNHRNQKIIQDQSKYHSIKPNSKKKLINPIEEKISSIATMMRNLRNKNNNCQTGNNNN